MKENEVQTVEKTHDFTALDLKQIQEYEEAGLPEIHKVTEIMLINMLELYITGKTYREICKIHRLTKPTILYLSKKFDWYSKKVEYLRDLEESMIKRNIESRINGQDFLLRTKHYLEKKIGDNIQNYLQTGKEEYSNAIDLREIDKYIKVYEALHKISNAHNKDKNPKAPTVGVNVGDGVTMTKIDENTVEITPTQKSTGDMLKKFANLRREVSNQSDINKKDTPKGEKNETG